MRGTSNYRWINNGQHNKYCKIAELPYFLDNGWQLGLNDKFRQTVSNAIKGKIIGKCKDPIKELERKQKISKAMKGNTNWMFNKHRGGYTFKKGIYKNIYCDSSWELAFVVYHIEHGMHIERCNKYYNYTIDGRTHKYNPDFVTDDGIFEIKGKKDKKALEKEKSFPNVIVIDSSNIGKYINYVTAKYGHKFYDVLYEDYNTYRIKKIKQHAQEKKNKHDNILKEKQIIYTKYNSILKEACEKSKIDFTKYGWSVKLQQYLKDRNLLFDKQIYRALKKYFPEFFSIYQPFLRKSRIKNQ